MRDGNRHYTEYLGSTLSYSVCVVLHGGGSLPPKSLPSVT